MDSIKTKVRGLIEDFLKSDFETFTYTISSVFTLAEDNIQSISSVLKNGAEIGSGDYSFDSTTKELTITASLSANDEIKVNYTYYKYSDTELTGYIRSALVWISIYANCEDDFEIENNDIYPTPENTEKDLMALIASILINPNWTRKSLPNLTVTYPKKMSKEEKIRRLINEYYKGAPQTDLLDWNNETA